MSRFTVLHLHGKVQYRQGLPAFTVWNLHNGIEHSQHVSSLQNNAEWNVLVRK